MTIRQFQHIFSCHFGESFAAVDRCCVLDQVRSPIVVPSGDTEELGIGLQQWQGGLSVTLFFTSLSRHIPPYVRLGGLHATPVQVFGSSQSLP